MHHSRLCAVLIDCKTTDVDEAAHFWAAALGRPVDLDHPMSRDNYRMLATPTDEPIVEIQRVEHEPPVSAPAADLRKDELHGASTIGQRPRFEIAPESHIRNAGSRCFSERDDSTQRCPQMPSDMMTPRRSSPAWVSLYSTAPG